MKIIDNNNRRNSYKHIISANDLNNKNNNNFDISDISNRRLIIDDSSMMIDEGNKIGKLVSEINNMNNFYNKDILNNDNKQNYLKINEKKNSLNEKEKEIVYDFHKLELLNHFVEVKTKRKQKIFDYTGCEICCTIFCPGRSRKNYMQNKVKIFEALNVYIDSRFECKTFMNIYDEQKQLRNIVFDENQNKTFDYVSKDFSDILINNTNSEDEISKKIYDFNENYNRSTKKDIFDENLFKYMEDSLRDILKH